MTVSNVIIWGQPGCTYCDRAWDLVDSTTDADIDYRIIGEDWTKEEFLEANPGKRSVPQIYVDGNYVGGYEALVKYLNQ